MRQLPCPECDNVVCVDSGCMAPPMRPVPLAAAAGRRHLANRRDGGLTVTVIAEGHLFDVSIGFFDDAAAQVAELFFEGRGKSGGALDEVLGPLGIAISRDLQRLPTRPACRFDPITLSIGGTSPPLAVAFQRFAGGPRAGDLSAIEITAPSDAGYDVIFRAISTDLSLILRDLPPPRTIVYGRPGAPILLGRQAWSARRAAAARALLRDELGRQ